MDGKVRSLTPRRRVGHGVEEPPLPAEDHSVPRVRVLVEHHTRPRGAQEENAVVYGILARSHGKN